MAANVEKPGPAGSTAAAAVVAPPAPVLDVAPAPHCQAQDFTTQRMMLDVLIALVLPVAMAIYLFHWHAVAQLGVCILSCLAGEAVFNWMRRKPLPLSDCSAAVTGAILGLSLPWNAPWYAGVIAGLVGVGIGKVIFGGLGCNIFNPAMVGRAFVMLSFPAALGAAGYQDPNSSLAVVTQATPLTAAKQLSEGTELWPLFIGTTNGSLGETSALACLLGGLYLCLRRTASWEIAAGVLLAAVVCAGGAQLAHIGPPLTLLQHLLAGALIFGAFFIATDPVTSPLTPWGKFIFGLCVGALVIFIRVFSGYPEGVMFAVLIMNSITPLLNRWTVPVPVGGRGPEGARV